MVAMPQMHGVFNLACCGIIATLRVRKKHSGLRENRENGPKGAKMAQKSNENTFSEKWHGICMYKAQARP